MISKSKVSIKLIRESFEEAMAVREKSPDSDWIHGRVSGLRTALTFLNQDAYIESVVDRFNNPKVKP